MDHRLRLVHRVLLLVNVLCLIRHRLWRVFHEEPQVLHYGQAGTGLVLEEGMTFTIEPMFNAGMRHTKLSRADGWTVTTKDRRLSAQWEHTLAVTATGFEVFTLRGDDTL